MRVAATPEARVAQALQVPQDLRAQAARLIQATKAVLLVHRWRKAAVPLVMVDPRAGLEVALGRVQLETPAVHQAARLIQAAKAVLLVAKLQWMEVIRALQERLKCPVCLKYPVRLRCQS